MSVEEESPDETKRYCSARRECELRQAIKALSPNNNKVATVYSLTYLVRAGGIADEVMRYEVPCATLIGSEADRFNQSHTRLTPHEYSEIPSTLLSLVYPPDLTLLPRKISLLSLRRTQPRSR